MGYIKPQTKQVNAQRDLGCVNLNTIAAYFDMVPGVTRQDAELAAKRLGWTSLNCNNF